MFDSKLSDNDPDDLNDAIIEIETLFDLKFEDNALWDVKTFGELCDIIIDNIQLSHSDTCTTQQAFYKLRAAISKSIGVVGVVPQTALTDILPKKHRIKYTEKIAVELDMKLSILSPPNFVTWTLMVILVSSLLGMFLRWKIGVPMFIFSVLGFYVSHKLGKELTLKTVGDLASEIARDEYLKSRRHPDTFNKNEMENVLINLFSNRLGLDKSLLTRDAALFHAR